MKNTAADREIDYKLLYERSLEIIEEFEQAREKSQAAISQKDLQIDELTFQLDRFRRYLYGQKWIYHSKMCHLYHSNCARGITPKCASHISENVPLI